MLGTYIVALIIHIQYKLENNVYFCNFDLHFKEHVHESKLAN